MRGAFCLPAKPATGNEKRQTESPSDAQSSAGPALEAINDQHGSRTLLLYEPEAQLPFARFEQRQRANWVGCGSASCELSCGDCLTLNHPIRAERETEGPTSGKA